MYKNEKGFSLIELLLVVTIVGIISVMAIPWLFRAIGAAENKNAYASLKTIAKSQVSYYAKNSRFARLDELNSAENNSLGTTIDDDLQRGVFTLTMNPSNPTDAELSGDYEIIATKGVTNSDTPCILSITASGEITELVATNNCLSE